jgi:hypothetical protein
VSRRLWIWTKPTSFDLDLCLLDNLINVCVVNPWRVVLLVLGPLPGYFRRLIVKSVRLLSIIRRLLDSFRFCKWFTIVMDIACWALVCAESCALNVFDRYRTHIAELAHFLSVFVVAGLRKLLSLLAECLCRLRTILSIIVVMMLVCKPCKI